MGGNWSMEYRETKKKEIARISLNCNYEKMAFRKKSFSKMETSFTHSYRCVGRIPSRLFSLLRTNIWAINDLGNYKEVARIFSKLDT